MASADSVDLLCAFVRWHGVRLLEGDLRELQRAGIPFRVVTTTYLGSTERRALDRLIEEFGAEVRVQYDSQRTRLHAKAWLFRRKSGFDTAYVGSSNLSRAALLDGVEWNVRLSNIATPSLLRKFEATFDSYWNDASFERYDPAQDRDRLDDALLEASGRKQHDRVTLTLSGLEVRPYSYQQKMLDDLEVERTVRGRHHNLVVAATGTGKTVVAALDYRRLATQSPSTRPSLLFIAHRAEILEQSRRTYREVLADGNFGEPWYGGSRPERGEHVFASVQSLNSYGIQQIPPDAFDIVVIDEFHHAQAPTYRRIIDHLAPRELLGLTATPERADGTDVRDFFGGRITTELRLWDALESDLLCPFHYFAVADNTDLSSVTWRRGRYDDAELEHLYTGNDARAAIVLRELNDKVADLSAMRALGFCVSVAHAHYMAKVFNDAGIPSSAVSAETTSAVRAQALSDLRGRRVNVVLTVDLFNEGLDIPDIDTVLFLRPTESATVFLQQFGRGLRRTTDKAVLTALDFVGHQNAEFRWDAKLRALTGRARGELVRDVEEGFPFLPSGSQIILDRTSQELILENVKAQVTRRWPQVVQELRSMGDTTLPDFLHRSGLPLSEVLRQGKKSWTQLRIDAGLPIRIRGELAPNLFKRGRALAHVDDPDRAAAYVRLLSDDAPAYAHLSEIDQRYSRMLFFSVWPDGGGFTSYDAGLDVLRREEAVRDELSAVVELALDAAEHVTSPLAGELRNVPLRVHARYQREEILAAVDYATLERKPTSMMQGVAYAPAVNADLLMATLKKSEADYSPTTMYRDYPISPTLFHWESQNATTVSSPTGQRYLNGTSNILLFVRDTHIDPFGTAPYQFLGPASYVSHQGERPIAITWRLMHSMPADFFQAATVAVQ
ncbi:DEAD/DEAH box helicase [Nocardioides aquiterrae]|uniref:DEAD/DEAH box helicase n=2 Tax=Nocardioides aquiterrae TaxID=203799 RepID=A0ABP4EZB9_9ACTN